jgi:hypothetical protein
MRMEAEREREGGEAAKKNENTLLNHVVQEAFSRLWVRYLESQRREIRLRVFERVNK